MDVKEKIAKLLALAKSPNEHEAKQAMLKARELMALHKLREDECVPEKNKKLVNRGIGIYCTKRLNSWMVPLSAVIAKNYCCSAWRNRHKHAQKVEIGFIGFEDDFEICRIIFTYAVDCILSRCQKIRDECKEIYVPQYISKLTDAYGYGFKNGVLEAFATQQAAHADWGLVLVVPAEVQSEADKMKTTVFQEADFGNPDKLKYARAGYLDGTEFDPSTKLPQESKGA